MLDNSVLQRIPRSTSVADAVRRLLRDDHMLCSSPISVLEAGFSARSSAEHAEIVAHLVRGFELSPCRPATSELAFALQTALFAAGTGRAVGALDLLSAACALDHGALLVHYDADFESLARVWPGFQQAWVLSGVGLWTSCDDN